MRPDDIHSLPPGLPVPEDDGAARHLPGRRVPAILLPSTAGLPVRLDQGSTRWTVVYAYPRTGQPDQASPPGLDDIPGARGCTPQSCNYRDHYAELRSLDAAVYGLSTQSTAYQLEMATRLGLPYPVLSDEGLHLTRALELPTFRYGDWVLLKRLTLLIEAGVIRHAIYPVFPPTADLARVLELLGE